MCRNASFARIVFAAIAFILTMPSAASAENWRSYHNDRYGTTIDYPDVFRAGPPPTSDDGLAFKTADGANFSVSASYNALDFDLAKFLDFSLKNLAAGAVVTYQTHGNNWFVISGTKGDGIFYEKHVLSHNGQMTESFVMFYPARLKQTYDPIVTRMSQSFRSGTGFQTPDKP